MPDGGNPVDLLEASFDPDFYRTNYADLAHFDEAEVRRHYRAHGIAEGRQGCAAGVREGFVALLPRDAPVLEIGPFANPVARGAHVRYADVLSTQGLRERAASLGLDAGACPKIDYFLPTMDLDEIAERFDAVVSCHCIEHQPDLVRHLQAVERLLSPGGRYFLLVPDRRYCFDHFLPASGIAGVMSAYARKAGVHDVGSIIEHWALTTHNDSSRHWVGDHGSPHIDREPELVWRCVEAHKASAGAYIDVHAWQFDPASFARLMHQIGLLGLSALRATAIYPTVRPHNEFCAVLERA